MTVAIIGAGFAGLATAYFLLESGKVEVTIFEASHVGAGASGVASGLLHPYPGLSARRSHRAEEALLVAKQLLRVAEKHTPKKVTAHQGIFRQSLNIEQQERLLSHGVDYGDVECLQEHLFLIHSGITVLSENYLEGLMGAILQKGGKLFIQKINTLKELQGFDQIVVAAGYGIQAFPECEHLKVKFIKGQVLKMSGNAPYEKSFISKGYIAHVGNHLHFEVGSTYEREFTHSHPDFLRAKELLSLKLSLCRDTNILDCKAGVRVCMQGHYSPTIEKIGDNIHVFTGLGSRGLLYHGLYGRTLAHTILSRKHAKG